MKVLIIVHANMALTDCWTYMPKQGREFYNNILSVSGYDLVIAPFFRSYYADDLHKFAVDFTMQEHDEFVEQCRTEFDITGFEKQTCDLVKQHIDSVLLENAVTSITFVGGYATDCLPSTVYKFLTDYGSYCVAEGIAIEFQHDLIYNGRHVATLDKSPETVVDDMIDYSGFYRFPDLIVNHKDIRTP